MHGSASSNIVTRSRYCRAEEVLAVSRTNWLYSSLSQEAASVMHCSNSRNNVTGLCCCRAEQVLAVLRMDWLYKQPARSGRPSEDTQQGLNVLAPLLGKHVTS